MIRGTLSSRKYVSESKSNVMESSILMELNDAFKLVCGQILIDQPVDVFKAAAHEVSRIINMRRTIPCLFL